METKLIDWFKSAGAEVKREYGETYVYILRYHDQKKPVLGRINLSVLAREITQ